MPTSRGKVALAGPYVKRHLARVTTSATPMLTGIVDLHSHFIPGVDDGARAPEEAVQALVAMAAQGCDTCVTTPHFDASLLRQRHAMTDRLAAFDRAWDLLGAAMAEHARQHPDRHLPALLRGTEVMLDDPEPDLSDPRLRLAGGPFVLVEFPALQLPPNADVGIAQIARNGWRPIVAHPERYRNLESHLETLRRMREVGAFFQLNAGSLSGRHGAAAGHMGRWLLEQGWISLVASDHHARGTPQLTVASAMLEDAGGGEQARQLLSENPRRVLHGAAPLDVAPLRPPRGSGWWRRIFGR